jgi:hypothetical protein
LRGGDGSGLLEEFNEEQLIRKSVGAIKMQA